MAGAGRSGAVKAGVVGLGYFGSFHARHYAANPAASLVAVADADAARAEAAAKSHGAHPFTDHHQLIGKVEAVSVTVPTSLHHRVATDFIEAGVHVLVEKPVTDDPRTARDLVERAGRKGVVLQIGHIERFSSTFAALRREVRQPLMIDAVRTGPWTGRAADVDVVLDLMIHDIDLALSLAGASVADVQASGASVVSRTIDTATARITFENGVVATLHASRVAPSVDRRIRVTEADAVLVADLAQRRLEIGRRADIDGRPALPFRAVEIEPADALGAEISAFVDSVATGRPGGVDGNAGLAALVLAERIRDEIRNSRPGSGRHIA